MIVTNKLNECIFSIPSPFDEDKSIDLSISLRNKTKRNVKIINGSPYISLDIKLKAKILSVNNNTDYFEDNNLELIESYANSYVKNLVDKYLYKTSKEFKSDIASFGKYAVIHFATWDKWIEYNWLNNYSNAFFNTNVDVDISSGYLVS